MRFLRFFVDLQSGALFRRALARRCTRVRDSRLPAFSAGCSCTFALSFDLSVADLPKLLHLVGILQAPLIGTKPTFNPHNSTRPPQPPAASF
jgi:hypothetical protein